MSEFEARMAVLRERFRERAAQAECQIRDAMARGDREALERASHSLSGSAGIFGHAELGLAAEQVELGIEADIPANVLEARCEFLLERLVHVRR
jgi:HPt (histidine-containing phosphotransfer) domain-containing protein